MNRAPTFFLQWQRYGKRRSFSRLALDRNLAAEQEGEFFDDVKPQADAAVKPGLGAVHLVELVEDAAELLRSDRPFVLLPRFVHLFHFCHFAR